MAGIPGPDHFYLVAEQIREGSVVPFLGAGANLCGRPAGAQWEHGRYLPSGNELAHALAEKWRYDESDRGDLLRVSQYVDAVVGERPLYKYLRALFDADYPPTDLHRTLARIPPLLRAQGVPAAADPDHQLRRRARARVPGRGRAVRRRLVRGQERAQPRPLHPSAARRRTVVISRSPNEYRRLSSRRAAGDPQAPRRGRAQRRALGPATSSRRTTTSSTSRPVTSRTRSRSSCASTWPTAPTCSSATACATGTCG